MAIPAAQLRIELGEDGERIFFRDRSVPGLGVFTDDASVLDARVSGGVQTVRNFLEQAASRREIARRLRITAYVLAACVVLGWLAVLATHLMVRSLVARVPPSWEQEFGDERITELKGEGVLLADSNRVARLTSLVAPLLQVLPKGTDFKFHIMESDVPNAFALPGGHIVVNTGLLKIADNRELIGVIAHEAAHITQKHFARKIISSAGPLIIFGTFMHTRSGLVNLVGQGSELMLTRGFSQEYETEADETGWNYLVQANIDPRGMIGIFKKFKAAETKAMLAKQAPQAFQTHPALDKRIARLEAKWKKLARSSGFVELDPVDLHGP